MDVQLQRSSTKGHASWLMVVKKNKAVGDMIVERVVLDRHTHNMNFILKIYC